MIIEGREFERTGEKPRTTEGRKDSGEPRNYTNPEPLNTSHIGKSVTITLVNGRIESGKLKTLGAYMLSIQGANGKDLIVNKGAIMTVSVIS